MQYFTNTDNLFLLVQDIIILASAIILAKLLQLIIIKILKCGHFFNADLTKILSEKIASPLNWLLIFIAIYSTAELTNLPPVWILRLQLTIKPISVAVLGWLIMNIINAVAQWFGANYSGKRDDNWGHRRFNTQVTLFSRALNTIIVTLTIIGMALAIPTLRELGMSLFASAGIAGIVLGIAAKESLSNLIAGVQLAFTQQILLGDEVVINKEFGTVEEITSSYVILKLPDLRRIIVPLRYFMENPFENWTFHEPDVTGTVSIFTDYNADIAAIRAETLKVTHESKFWDGKTCTLVVANSKETTIELSATVSAKNSLDLSNLRFEVREKLVQYLQTKQEILPRTRVLVDGDDSLGKSDNY